jgi:hypothetical protein
LSGRRSVKPSLEFIPPRYNPWVMRMGYAFLPLFLQVRLRPWLPAGIWPVTCENPEVLVEQFEQFDAGKVRLILAFRHSQVDDPLCLSYMFSRILPAVARAEGIPRNAPFHSHFMYDRGMPLWAGSWLGWFFSRMGGIPIHRGKRLDLKALKTVREYLVNGQFPFTIAPEGATNGHGEIISPLEPGTAQIAFWTVEDLQKVNRPEQVVLLPVGLKYLYPEPDWAALNQLMSQLEADCGLPVQSFAEPSQAKTDDYYERLITLAQHLLARMEEFYQRFYNQKLSLDAAQASGDTSAAIAQRLSQILEGALQVGEQFFGLPSSGSIITRCRRLEEAGWSYIYRDDFAALQQLPPLEKGLADWIADEAGLQMRHMRLVESFVAVTGSYVKANPTFERFAETTLIMFDMVERVKGTKVPRRPKLGTRQAVITIGDPMNINDRWADYSQSRRAAKAAVETLTADLQRAMEALF